MSNDSKSNDQITVQSSRFGEFSVPHESVIDIPSGLIGFPQFKRYVMVEHKAPFSWLHSVDSADLAFVVVDGFQFGEKLKVKPPYGDKDIELNQDDEYAILVIVTVRSDPQQTTANLKAPVFVNVRNRKGVQVIFDDPQLSTRFPLWTSGSAAESEAKKPSGEPEK